MFIIYNYSNGQVGNILLDHCLANEFLEVFKMKFAIIQSNYDTYRKI